VVPVTDVLARRVAIAHEKPSLSQVIGNAPPTETLIGSGDVLQVTVMEAPPAVLFGADATLGPASAAGIPGVIQQQASIPQLTVDENGRIRVPFAGSIAVGGRSPAEVEREIQSRLSRKAHLPQVSVTIARNTSSTVAVMGEVRTSGRIPITPRGERLLDVIADAGGVSQPVNKTTVEVQRHSKVGYAPLETVIRDPDENIRLGRNDVVTLLYQEFSFTTLGAIGTSGQIPFESTGISLAEALGRAGGLKEDRANPNGAFIFRFEDPDAVDPAIAAVSRRTSDGRIPVIYRFNFRDPASLFIAKDFQIEDKDIVYVSTAPISDLQRFVGILSSLAFTAIGLGQALPNVP
jgi:polysaccharide export outer membrane protein